MNEKKHAQIENPLIAGLAEEDHESAFRNKHGMSTEEWVQKAARRTGRFDRERKIADVMAKEAWAKEREARVEHAAVTHEALKISRGD